MKKTGEENPEELKTEEKKVRKPRASLMLPNSNQKLI